MDKNKPINLTSGVQSFKRDLEGKKLLYGKQKKILILKKTSRMQYANLVL